MYKSIHTGEEVDAAVEQSKNIAKAFVDLGIVSMSSEAESAAVELAGNRSVCFIKYETSNGQVGIIRQRFSSGGNTLQYLWLNGVEYVRTVNYDSGLKSGWHNINKASLVYKLRYNQGSRIISFHDPIQDEGFGGVELPEASTDRTGLMTPAQVQAINDAVKTTGAQAINGVKTFNDNINIASKSVIAKNIDSGEFKLLHNNSSKGFIIRTRNTSDSILPVEILSTNGYDSLKYDFPSKSGTVALLSDIEALTQQITALTQQITALTQVNNG